MLTDSDATRRAEAVLQFNRFYTKYLGALHEQLPRSAFSLTEIRILSELADGRAATAAALARSLSLDTGYLSRILSGFERRALISRRPSTTDARQSLLSLTEAGHAEYAPLDAAALGGIAAALAKLSPAEQDLLIGALRVAQRLLGEGDAPGIVTLRAPRVGDLGWIVHRFALIFARKHRWSAHFEALAAHAVSEFALGRNPAREAAWIADQDGAAVGSALLGAADESRACVRMLYVEPHVRRLGVGSRLLDECLRFARGAGYATIDIDLAPGLPDGRRMVRRAGFAPAGEAETRVDAIAAAPLTERWTRSLETLPPPPAMQP